MRSYFEWFAVALVLVCGGCSIYPLPEDVTGFRSEDVSTIVRCNTRDAVRDELILNLLASGRDLVYGGRTGDQLAADLKRDPNLYHSIDFKYFRKPYSIIVPYYANTSISYDFTIDSTEVNTAGVNVSLLNKLYRGGDTLGLQARNDRTREVKRHFQVFDSVGSLAFRLPEATCRGVPNGPDPIYPVDGLLRIRSLVHSFFVQNQIGNLGGEKEDYATAQMSDTITFNTKFTGNLDPSTAYNPVTHAVVPSSVALNLDNSRQDMDTIIVLIRLPPKLSGLPRFDEIGRLASSEAESRKAVAAAALDRQRDYNTQDALIQLGTGVGRTVPSGL